MAANPPFIYDRPSAYSFNGPTDRDFNPRAVTQASWVPPARQTPKKDGPLINLNRHPDSVSKDNMVPCASAKLLQYLLVPYGNLNAKPMHPNTKDKVRTLRRAQLVLRIVELTVALGLLFCIIVINKTTGALSWLIRVAPAVATLHTLYAVYHLSRNVNRRSATSTASYMLFAVIVDAGLLPFLAISALVSHRDYTFNTYGWNTMFNVSDTSYTIIHVFFYANAAEAAIIILSLVLGISLVIYFRQIAKLPPDMNPLEPNLTARPHHKRNKSELGSDATEVEKPGSRLSNNSGLNVAGTRRVPFLHTRTESADSITLYGNNSARNSKTTLIQKEESEYRKSQHGIIEGLSRPASAINPALTSRAPGVGLDSASTRSSETPRKQKTSSWLSYMKSSDYEGACRNISGYSAIQLNERVPHPEPVSPQHLSHPTTPEVKRLAESQNWYERSAHNSHVDLLAQGGLEAPRPPSFIEEKLVATAAVTELSPLPQQSKKRSREPLGMNPPTPRLAQHDPCLSPHTATPDTPESPRRPDVLGEIDGNSQQSSRTTSFVGSGGKGRFYGNLRRSISSASRHHHDTSEEAENIQYHDHAHGSAETFSPVDEYNEWEDEPVRPASAGSDYTLGSKQSYNIEIHGDENGSEAHDPAIAYARSQQRFQTQWVDGARKISGTDHDLNGGYAGLGPEFGRGMAARHRGRDVSGKIAEEGRGDGGSGNAVSRVRGSIVGKAAGWAKFGGR